jgi:hypothetical protein
MSEVRTSPEYAPKRQTVTTFEYNKDGNILSQTEIVSDIPKVEDKILSVKSVTYDMVDEMLKAGYHPKSDQAYYAKNVIMVLTEASNLKVMDEALAQLKKEELD